MGILVKLKRMLKDRKVLLAFLLAVLLSVFGYFTNNWPLFSGEALNRYTFMEWVKRFLYDDDESLPGAFFVNTSMDKQLIDVYENECKVGTTEVTDRRKLLAFLKLLKQTDYKYLVIDIRFPDELACQDSAGSRVDKELFDQIRSMDRCVVATHHDMKLLGGLESKTALADYKSTVTSTNFIRYEYFDVFDSIPSIPLHVYNEIRKEQHLDTINYSRSSPYFGMYSEGGVLCQNSLFLEFSSKGFPQLKKILTESGDSLIVEQYSYEDMGRMFVDHLEGCSEAEMVEQLQDMMDPGRKGNRPIVFIGNLAEDLHDTYAGLQPGTVILYKAICALQDGKHIVSPIRSVLLFLMYFAISLFIFKRKSLLDFVPEKYQLKFPLFSFLLQMLGVSALLFVADIVCVKVYGVTTNFVLAILVFGFLKLHLQFKRQRYE